MSMRLADLNGKTVCILGFGKEGKSMLAAIEAHAPECEVTIADQNEAVEVPAKHWKQVGTGWLENLSKFDAIIKSPGIPPSPELKDQNSKLTTPTNIFMNEISSIGATLIGVTGSKGKSTTTSLIYHVLSAAKKPAVLCGNIGVPALDMLEKITKESIVVMEMSSYQLMDVTMSPHIAVLTSFFPEHLDYHGSLEAYFEAKANIVRFQSKDDFVFFNSENADTKRMALLSKGKQIGSSYDECPLPLNETKLIGDHNRSNIALAYKVAKHLGVDDQVCLDAFKTFTPLPHRLQSLGMHHGILWIDDAISTTPDSAIAALRALGPDVATVILGGTDRGLTFDTLAEELVDQSQVSTVILFAGTGPKIRSSIEEYLNKRVDRKISLQEADSMALAVNIAKEHTPQGKICLLSTASPSYNMFKNFEDKGTQFQQCIQKA